MNKQSPTHKSKTQVKFKVQKIIALSLFIIFAGKLVAYFLTNSVGILTDALESTVNVATGFITLYSIYVATKPQDENHPYGHGKAEFLSASVEGFLIIIAGIIIIYEAVKRLFLPAEILQLDIGIVIVAVAGLFNYLLGWYSIRTGKKHKSIALISGGKHLQSDTYSSIGLVAGLLILYFTGEVWLDSLIALIFGTIIIITGIRILKETTSHLMDEADFELIKQFRNVIKEHKSDTWIDIHNFKLVKYGNAYHINCDLVLPYFLNLAQAHEEGEKLKKLVVDSFSEEIIFNLHIDECFKLYCKNCKQENCPARQEKFIEEADFDLKKFINEKPEEKV
ncbi:Ferrous-iron efflux pump FieF [Salinivirga cyanobacteriivorans]|uniref:Ferrous-iron efflux pump FieF n=1 Tax=Salinivirga cyanobacteriivorans TaxID=1307839 RepID=A0A0S2I1W7_9BACT|nr:cation diffusion facilitator family transporter [Salinivirga cyanobacteriivorans]ALO16424.1 Ferrous-iron efflux pump FieF [Salinivirga cyanobacteriivorans]